MILPVKCHVATVHRFASNPRVGFVPTYDAADLVVVNTCGFIDDAVHESLDAIGEALAQNGRVIVTGCLGAKPEKIIEHHPAVEARPVPRPGAAPGRAPHVAPLRVPVGEFVDVEVMGSSDYDLEARVA
jgi:ribosomal protein S12 methylthiotransferase